MTRARLAADGTSLSEVLPREPKTVSAARRVVRDAPGSDAAVSQLVVHGRFHMVQHEGTP